MATSVYACSLRDRVNPEFVGIAEKLSQKKQNRLQAEARLDHQLRCLKTKASADLHLAKAIGEQSTRLREARLVRGRRLADQQRRREQQQLVQARLRSLSAQAKEQREQMRASLSQALRSTFSAKRRSRAQTRKLQEQGQDRIRQNRQAAQQRKQRQCQQARRAEHQRRNSVNQFYRTLNRHSLDNYKRQIRQQSQRARHCQQQLQALEEVLRHFDRNLGTKKERLLGISSQLQSQCGQGRGGRGGERRGGVCGTKAVSSCSSRPQDILLQSKGSREFFRSDFNTVALP